MLRLWRKCRRLPAATRWLAIEAAVCLLLARIVLLIIPFPRIVRRFGGFHPPALSTRASLSGDPVAGDPIAKEIGRVVERTADWLGCGMVCLPRALAASNMLARRGIVTQLHFGAARPEPGRKMLTHAWLDTQGVEVTGYPLATEFVEVGYLAR